jgi:1-acyl-sn-glycerol-3-phosphate acyltransferase
MSSTGNDPHLTVLGGPVLRRCVTVPFFLGALVLLTALLPVALLAMGAVDLLRWLRGHRPPSAIRCLAAFWCLFFVEAICMLGMLLSWLLGPPWTEAGRRRCLRWTKKVEIFYQMSLHHCARVLFRLRYDVEGDGDLLPGPILIIGRHSSALDTVLPTSIATMRYGLQIRYVLKLELIYDPCFDIVADRLPHCFVGREGQGDDRDRQAVAATGSALGPSDAVLLYPEGTRFSRRKRERILRSLEQRAPELLPRAQRLRHLLPPRPGGLSTLLAAAPDADVVLFAHRGYEEGSWVLSELWNGGLVGRTIRVRFERLRRADIPTEPEARVLWLYDTWQRLDDWLEQCVQEERETA